MAERKLAEQDDRLPALSFERDRWRQIPVRVMVGNGITWVLQIVLDCDVKNGQYEIKKQTASESVLNLIKSIPVCTGLGIKSDVEEVEQFYSELSGQQIKMKGLKYKKIIYNIQYTNNISKLKQVADHG